uniref:Roadblock/LAMTOR2 domain-containing protein n=1 Tax=Globisporangium ultimum (strain ATCC 200006 / CBS 805.95 / DAOM BR144) TaxID=431595 RepID=K3X7C8_GLOUD
MMGAELSPVLVEQLNTVLDRFEALEAILVCTSEGVPLLKVMADEEKATLAYDYAETVLPTVFAGAAEQIGKLKFGAVQTVTSFFDNVVLIHINNAPLVITLVASNSAHIGALQALASELRPALSPLKKAVESADVH